MRHGRYWFAPRRVGSGKPDSFIAYRPTRRDTARVVPSRSESAPRSTLARMLIGVAYLRRGGCIPMFVSPRRVKEN